VLTGKNRPLRVLYLADSFRVGGKERQAVELLKGLRSLREVELMVVTMGEEQFYVPDLTNAGIPVRYLIRAVKWDPVIFWRLFRLLCEFRPDIVHTNSDLATFYALPLTKLRRSALVNGTLRGAMKVSGFRGLMRRCLLHLSPARIANSRAGLESVGLREDGARNFVVYNGFDLARLGAVSKDMSGVLAKFGGARIVGMVAECSDYKDYPTFVRAAQIVLRARHDVVFVAVGGGANLEALRNLAAHCDRSVHFIGERHDIEELVGRMYAAVLSTHTEGLSNSVMEYMAAGKPAIVTDVGGCSELVVDGTTGFLVPAADAGEMARKIELLLDDRDLAQRLGKAGRRRLEEVFSLQRLVANTLNVYRAVIRPRRPVPRHSRKALDGILPPQKPFDPTSKV
jgi:glycosyltransferase involved in cell wall biosynthesis